MNKRGLFIFIFAIFLITVASAEIFLSKQPQQLYTLGDDLELELGTDGEEGWTRLNLICSNKTQLLFFNYLTEDDTEKELTFSLTKEFLRGMNGECAVSLLFNEEEKQSLAFTIDDAISVDVILNAMSFEPNSTIEFSGVTSKRNGQKVDGFAEVTITNTELEIIEPIENNKFNGELLLPENIAAGEYTMDIFVYEKEGEDITNFGLQNFTLTISQQPREVSLEVGEEVIPSQDMEFKATLYDQSEQTIDGNQVSFILTNSEGEEILNILSNTGDSNFYKLRSNTPVGYLNLTATSEEISTLKQIFVKENEEALFKMINNTLIIRNIGNVPYEKYIEIAIENYTEVKNLSLEIGESLEFTMEAPDGEYEIKVKDDKQEFTGTTQLTGSVIAIKEGNTVFFNTVVNKNSLAWMFIILIAGLFIFASVRRYTIKRKGKFPSLPKLKKPKLKKEKENLYQGGVVKVTPTSQEQTSTTNQSTASHSLVINGNKQKSAIIALKIKNKQEIENSTSNTKEIISNTIKLISSNNGRVYKSEDYIIGIFAPAITKTFHNSFNSLKIADQIASTLNEHNRKYTQKINFGIGISAGEIIAKTENGKLSFTPLGNSLTDAKRISEIADNAVLIGEEISKEVRTQAKLVSYPARFGLKTFAVKELLDRSQNEKFINSFLNRNSEYKKLDEFRLGK
jgi:hypothetical protein